MKKYINNVPPNSNLIDVLSYDSFYENHLKGAKNYCVYEVAFLEKFKTDFLKKDTYFVLYGWSDKTFEAERAYYLLSQNGYTNLSILKGGLKKKLNSKDIVKKGKKNLLDKKYMVNPNETRIEWTGRNIGNKHFGNIKVKEGHFEFDKGQLISGSVIIDMNSINNLDQKGIFKDALTNHLKSDDFFSTKEYPKAKIELISSEKIKNAGSKPNYKLKANLTIKEITKKIEFDGFIFLKDEKMVLNSHFDIDRTRWFVQYGSEKFFSKLGIHLIDDIISFDLIIIGE